MIWVMAALAWFLIGIGVASSLFGLPPEDKFHIMWWLCIPFWPLGLMLIIYLVIMD